MTEEGITTIIAALLQRALSVDGTRQVFVFGPEGAPFWAAKTPILPEDLLRLDRALTLIEKLETSRPRPFFAHAPLTQLADRLSALSPASFEEAG